jgi:diguanylate cyclase (GGDEF)-like protein/PAS domain S-box-containing protein
MNIKSITIPKPSQASFTGQKLRTRYLIALSLIALLTVSSQIFIQIAFKNQESDSRIVNIAGRQRMLSQKIAKISYIIASTEQDKTKKVLLQELAKTVTLWKTSHQYLQTGNVSLGLPGNNSNEIIALFGKISANHFAILDAVDIILSSSAAPHILKQALENIRKNETSFLHGMNDIVFRYDMEARKKVNFTQYFELTLAVVILLVLVLEAFFIFAPAVKRITADMLELIRREEDLDTLFEVSPTVKLLVDPIDLSIIRVNHRAHKVLGLERQTGKHNKLSHFISDYYNENRSFFKTLANADSVDEYEIVIIATDKSVYPMLASVRKIRLRGEEVIVIGMADISEIKKAQEALELNATTDVMTGLVNRRSGMLMLEKLMAQSRRNNKELTLCFVDIDGLKITNDKYGHKSGDWLITTIGNTATEQLRSSDVIARIGGDEFLIIFPECDTLAASKKMREIQQKLLQIQSPEGKSFHIGFSFGVASYSPDSTKSAEELINEADKLMYENKRSK